MQVLKFIGALLLIYVCLAFAVIKLMLTKGYHVPNNSEINAYMSNARMRFKEEMQIRTFAKTHKDDISSRKREPHEREKLRASSIRRLG